MSLDIVIYYNQEKINFNAAKNLHSYSKAPVVRLKAQKHI